MQPEPKGIAQAFLVGEDFIGDDPVCLILGDNIFYGKMGLDKAAADFAGGAIIFGYYVQDPERYGVVEFDEQGHAVGIEEKPALPKTNYAVPGLYLYDNKVVDITKNLKPSPRGELEITDVNLAYLQLRELQVEKLGRGIAWLDTGTHQSLLEASHFIGTLEARQGLKIACLEEVALRMGYIDCGRMAEIIEKTPNSSYRDYMVRVLNEMGLCGEGRIHESPTRRAQFRTCWFGRSPSILDERGWLAELFRSDEIDPRFMPAMAYISMTRPGIARGPHEHREQVDCFAFIGPSNFKVYLWDSRQNSPTCGIKQVVYGGNDSPVLVIVPPGVVHAYKNVGSHDGIVFNAPNSLYAGQGKTSPVDEIRHEEEPGSPFILD